MALRIQQAPAPKVVEALKPPPPPTPIPAYLVPPPSKGPIPDFTKVEATFEQVEAFVLSRQRASAFELQTAFGITYGQAVRLMDALEGRGVIVPLSLYAKYTYRGARALMYEVPHGPE